MRWSYLTVAAVMLAGSTVSVGAQMTRVAPTPFNFIDEINLPQEQQHSLTRSLVEQLATSRIRTAREADVAAMRLPDGSSRIVRADENSRVTGLFYVESASLNSGAKGPPEIVWQVSVHGMGAGPVRSLYWVAARTGAVIQIFPKN